MLNETTLLHFFQEQIDLQELQDALDEEFYRDEEDAPSYHYTFQDMDSVHTVAPEDLVVFCDAILEGEMRAEGLAYIAECLLHAEKMTWDEDVISDVCHHWLDPDTEYAPDDESSLELFKRWLRGEEEVPESGKDVSLEDNALEEDVEAGLEQELESEEYAEVEV